MFKWITFLGLLTASTLADVSEVEKVARLLYPFGTHPPPLAPLKYVDTPSGPRPYIPIIHQNYDINPDGSYSYAYQTANGIAAQENGALRLQGGPQPSNSVTGAFAYTSPEGIPISVTYTADERGFRPQGAHLPTPPPIPPAILKALAWQAAHPGQK